MCDQACMDAIVQTLPPPAPPALTVDAVDLRSAHGSNITVFEPPLAKDSKGGTGRKDSGNNTQAADDAAAKAEFEADYDGKIDDLGWFMLLVALFLLLQVEAPNTLPFMKAPELTVLRLLYPICRPR